MFASKRDRIVLCGLLGLVFIVGNYYAYGWFTKKQAALKLSVASMRADQAEAQVALQESDLWAGRQAWLKAKQPPMSADEGDAKAAVLENVVKAARDNKLEVVAQDFNDVEHSAAGTRVNVTVKVKGGMEALVKWLTGLEKPDEFFAVTLFSLKADQDQKSFVCDVRIARFFKDKESSL